ncbi:MAG: lamin tail domain-containing protein [Phycisphaerae bacterium]|nr:lamin tail domain-containing protein [Phycisphaerae bacterium]
MKSTRFFLLLMLMLMSIYISALELFGAQRPAGDINNDYSVNLEDLQIFTNQWLSGFDQSDINGDDQINMLDLAFIAENWQQSVCPVVINEFLADNDSGIQNSHGERNDWIELYNPSDKPYDLSGMFLSDNDDNDEKWQFPTDNPEATTIPAKGYLGVWADNDTGDFLHADFKLSKSGEKILLIDADGTTVIDEIEFDDQQTDISYSRVPDGGDSWFLTNPTPLRTNNNAYYNAVADTKFNYKRGFYSSPINVSIRTETDNAQIYYTLDGSEPDKNSIFYVAPISINSTTTLRTRAYKLNYKETDIDTQTYIFLDDVISQSSYGQRPDSSWPNSNINGQIINYGMDPDIVNSAEYSELMDDALKAIPTISIVTNTVNLFNPAMGIYVNAGYHGYDWERPCSIELINPDGSEGFQSNAGIRIRGGFSRSNSNPKHAFRLFFRDEYGNSKLNYPLFGDEGADEFQKLDLRTAQNYSWSFQNDNRNTFLREIFSRDIQRDMGQPYTRSRYYHLYINGQYWGLYMSQERSEARYAESYFGGDTEDYDVVKVNAGPYVIEATDGTLDAWRRLWDATNIDFVSNDVYYSLQGLNTDGSKNPEYEVLLDPDNLIDYMICTMFVGDFDGPISKFLGNSSPNNFYGIYNRNTNEGFKFFRHDAEHSMFDINENRTGPFSAGSQFSKSNPHWLHQKLITNNNYKMLFADRAYEYLFNNGILTPEANKGRMQQRRDNIDLAIIAESARWGDVQRSTPYTRNDWINATNYLMTSYFNQRTDKIIEQFKNQGWYPQLEPPQFNQNGGQVDSDFQLIMTSSQSDIYYTTDGSDPRGNANSQSINITFFDENATKHAIVPENSSQASTLFNATGEFLVKYFKATSIVSNIEQAKNIISNSQPDSTEYTDVINYFNTGENGNLGSDNPFPSLDFLSDIDDFVIEATASVYIPETGEWTFCVNSDDGFALELDNGMELFEMDFSEPRGPLDTLETFTFTETGYYNLKLTYFERGGGAELELFAAQGEHFAFNDDFELIGNPSSDESLKTYSTWYSPNFDTSNWTTGTGGIGYETDINGNYDDYFRMNSVDHMYNKNTTCLIRIPFVASETTVQNLTMHVQYDDGFVAYLNGNEVARRNYTGDNLTWNTNADSSHSDTDAIQFEAISIDQYSNLLESGENILAIHALNISTGSTDFLINAQLTASINGDSGPTENSKLYNAPITLGKSSHIKARSYRNGSWSPLINESFSVGPIANNLRITEIMYNSADVPVSDPNVEYIELQNIGDDTINLQSVKFTEGIDFTFGDIELAAGEFILVVNNQSYFENLYGSDFKIAGEFTGSLDNAGEHLRLIDASNQFIHDFEYNDSWWDITDGDGFSLTIIDPGNSDISSWDNKNSWRPSANIKGSPGASDNGIVPEPDIIVINEILSHSHASAPDWIELYNTGSEAINIGGWFLSDSKENPRKYEIPLNTIIPGKQFIVFYQDQHFGIDTAIPYTDAFGLSENGETLYLQSGNAGELTGYYTKESFGASATGIAFGRYKKSQLAGEVYNFVPMSVNTPGSTNAAPKVGPVVISEIMYHPAVGGSFPQDEYEYIEIYNNSATAVTLQEYDPGTAMTVSWKFTSGIYYEFPAGITIPADSYIVIAKNPAAFIERYTPLGVTILGPYSGSLNNSGEKIQLSMPGEMVEQERYYIRIDRVIYENGSPWPLNADGLGDSLQRIYKDNYGNDPVNWHSAPANPGS